MDGREGLAEGYASNGTISCFVHEAILDLGRMARYAEHAILYAGYARMEPAADNRAPVRRGRPNLTWARDSAATILSVRRKGRDRCVVVSYGNRWGNLLPDALRCLPVLSLAVASATEFRNLLTGK